MTKKEIFLILGVIFILVLIVNISAVSVSQKNYLKCFKICSSEKTLGLKDCNYYYSNNVLYCRDDFNYCKDIANKSKKEVEKCKKSFSSCTRYAIDSKKDCKDFALEDFQNCKTECKSQNCSNNLSRVCGINGLTYNNSCFMRNAGIEKNYNGECVNYCYNDEMCREGEYCQNQDGMCSNLWPLENTLFSLVNCVIPSVDKDNRSSLNCLPPMGICKKIPEVCSLVYLPVCGCDGKTYSNNCVMGSAKVSKSYDGECKPQKCQELETNITNEIDTAIRCEKDSDCKIGYLGVPCNFMICATAFNKNADLTSLKSFSKEYISDCQPMFCPMYSCIDMTDKNAVCIDNYCQIDWNLAI